MIQEEQQQAQKGVIFALAAYLLWGIAPIYFKQLTLVSPFEILSHRVVWSFVLLSLLIHISRQWGLIRQLFRSGKTIALLCITSLLVGSNWLIFIWAISNNHMLDASLGYFINPIINVILGLVFLQERLRKMQWLAVTLAMAGVAVQLFVFGSIPFVAIALALSFGFYGLLRKKIAVDAVTGLFIETLVLFPVAAIYLTGFANSPTSNLANNSLWLDFLLFSAGIVTTIPLLCFAGAAKRLRLSTLGFFQYIGPSIMFLLAVIVYGETFSTDKAITFTFIWGALIIFSLDGLKNRRSKTLINALKNRPDTTA
ncbi:EamA family transporter RarD [Vibrio salinus]|uniref:EamA family transporter RarD n=1 Tax=Vibrio salinus TaxID=2899784 RepID=UPI001E37B4E2|nr:EamA family transporter RarD [Vibrio salinus]MCE0493717.1 EamA family transporter RarD [Vibrio salinus]